MVDLKYSSAKTIIYQTRQVQNHKDMNKFEKEEKSCYFIKISEKEKGNFISVVSTIFGQKVQLKTIDPD